MTQLEKYLWLIDKLHRYGPQSLADLSARWVESELSFGEPLQRCKFNRWRDDIFMIFGIEIACDRSTYKYSITDGKEIVPSDIQKRMIESFSLRTALMRSSNLYNRIIIDEVSGGCDFITSLLSAMREGKWIELTYQAYGKQPSAFLAEPWALRCHANRWYLLAKSEISDTPRIYALDRVRDMQLTEEHFSLPDDFEASAYFSRYFGVVINDETKPQRIVLRAFEGHANYLRSLPLHSSQEEIAAVDGEYADFRLFLAPTYDFIMALLGMGAMIEVLEPASLRQEIKTWAQEVVDLYH